MEASDIKERGKEKWVVAAKKADFQAIGREFGIDPVIARIIRNRGYTDENEIGKYLRGGRESLYDPHLLKDADRAAEILKEKISDGKKIRVIGDYDIDGVESTYILLQAFARCGADADEAIPERKKDGYGINRRLIGCAIEDGVDTIVTCDNGIAAAAEIRAAEEAGITVIVTDHHDIPDEPARADAVVNPKQADCSYPFKGLCGAAVAWKLVQVLYEKMGISVREADVFLENVGFATVGDVMDLRDENRILVKLGLEMFNRTENPGMRALIRLNHLDPGRISAYHIGFRLGPCINAGGRLATAQRALKLLLSRDEAEAERLAAELVELNEERKALTEQAVEEAEDLIEKEGMEEDRVLVIFLPDCDESIAGIAAGRIRERHNRPVLVLTRGETCAKGSGRSIECYNMFAELNRVKDLFIAFGGHPMAAGFSLEEERIPELRRRLNENTSLTDEDLVPKLVIDVPMPMDYVTPDFVHQLEILEPFGKGNEKPVFAESGLAVRSVRLVGKEKNVSQLKLVTSRGSLKNAVYFGDPENLRAVLAEKYGEDAAGRVMAGGSVPEIRLSFSYYPEIDSWRGEENLQFVVTGFQ